MKNALLTLLTLLLLLGFAAAIPLGSLTEDARLAYLNEAPADPEDEYAFLFD